MSTRTWVWVAAGTLLGGGLRAVLSQAAFALGASFPWSTVAANALGSLAIGVYGGLTDPGGRLPASPQQRHFVMTGVCGGFTTFSLFSLETVMLLESGRSLAALANVGATLLASLLAVWAGFALAGALNRLDGG